MDIYRKELKEIYDRQGLADETLDYGRADELASDVEALARLTGICAVITDISNDSSHFIPGASARLLELSGEEMLPRKIASSDEDFLYTKMHPADLVDLRMLEYELFKMIDTLPAEQKLHKEALAEIRMGRSLTPITKSTRALALSPSGKIWLMLCCYIPLRNPLTDATTPRIIDYATGDTRIFSFNDARAHLLTPREKEILTLIRHGLLSKEIASTLNISHNTVNRHRQNILEKLSVGNSFEAVRAATEMRLL